MLLDAQRRQEPLQWPTARLQARVHRFTFERQNRERALMHPAERLALDEPLQCFHAQGELPQSKRTLRPKPTRAQSFQVLRRRVLRSVDDPQVLFPPGISLPVG